MVWASVMTSVTLRVRDGIVDGKAPGRWGWKRLLKIEPRTILALRPHRGQTTARSGCSGVHPGLATRLLILEKSSLTIIGQFLMIRP